jgi:hypothetical protein
MIWDNSWKVALLTITGGELRLANLGYYLQALIDNGTIGGPIILTKSTSRGPRTRFGGRLFLQTAPSPPPRRYGVCQICLRNCNGVTPMWRWKCVVKEL